jgi:hypothetical protein
LIHFPSLIYILINDILTLYKNKGFFQGALSFFIALPHDCEAVVFIYRHCEAGRSPNVAISLDPHVMAAPFLRMTCIFRPYEGVKRLWQSPFLNVHTFT